MIILVGSNKGGTGKTTTAVNLASYYSVQKSVLLCDCDNQQSMYQWNAIRSASGLNSFDCMTFYGNIADEVLTHSKNYDITIIDVAGRNSEEFLSGLAICDVFISPIQVTQLDLNTLLHLKDQIDLLKEYNPLLSNRSFILHSRATTNVFLQHKEREDLESFLSELDNLTLLNATISERKIFKDSISEGKGVFDYKESERNAKAVDEYEFLIEEIQERVGQ